MARLSSATAAFLRGTGMALLLSLAACERKGGEGVVLSKEYIPAAVEGEPMKEHQTMHEQWKVKVEMRADMRKLDVLVEPAEWEKFKVGDRVNVGYSQGKYTGTVWSSEIK
jgi:predicted small lipoprotein YifL